MRNQTIISICPACDGTGYADYAAVPCETCDGDGAVRSIAIVWDVRTAIAWGLATTVVAILSAWVMGYLR